MAINYTERGYDLHLAVAAAGKSLMEIDGVWVASDDVKVQAIIDAFDPIPTAQAAKWEQIKAERDRRQLLGVRVGGSRFHSDEKSRIQQLGLVIMGADIPAGLQWKTLDKTFVVMTPELAGQIFTATAAHDQAIFAAAETHRQAMEQSENPSDYDFSAGWPEL